LDDYAMMMAAALAVTGQIKTSHLRALQNQPV
jgi:hypothetical protein